MIKSCTQRGRKEITALAFFLIYLSELAAPLLYRPTVKSILCNMQFEIVGFIMMREILRTQ